MKQNNYLQLLQEKHNKLKQRKGDKRKYIEMIIELVMYGDDKDEDIFDYFAEQNILGLLLELLKGADHKLTATIIEKTSMLITNIKQPLNLSYILSNPVLQDFITYHYNFQIPDIVDFYVNFLKTIALRVDENNLNLYYNQKYCQFPLLWQAQKFINYPDTLVKNTVQNIILTLTKVAAPINNNRYSQSVIYQQNKLINHFQDYLCHSPFKFAYWQFIFQFIQNVKNMKIQKNTRDLEELNMDIILFFQDLYQSCPFLGESLTTQFMEVAVIDILNSILLAKSIKLQIGCEIGLYILYKFMENLPVRYEIIKTLMNNEIEEYNNANIMQLDHWKYKDENNQQFYNKFQECFYGKVHQPERKIIKNPYKQEFLYLLNSRDNSLLLLFLAILQIIQQEKGQLDYNQIFNIFGYGCPISLDVLEAVAILVADQQSIQSQLIASMQQSKELMKQLNGERVGLLVNWHIIEQLQTRQIRQQQIKITPQCLFPSQDEQHLDDLKIVYRHVLLQKLLNGETIEEEKCKQIQKGTKIEQINQKVIKIEAQNQFLVLDEDRGLLYLVGADGYVIFVENLRSIEVAMIKNDLYLETHRMYLGPHKKYILPINPQDEQAILTAFFTAQKTYSNLILVKLLDLQI